MADPYLDYIFRFTSKANALAVLGEFLRDDVNEENGVGYDRSHIQRIKVITAEGTQGTPEAPGTPPTYANGLFVHVALKTLRPAVRDLAECVLVLSRQRALDGLNPVLMKKVPVALRNLRFEPIFAGVVYVPRTPATA